MEISVPEGFPVVASSTLERAEKLIAAASIQPTFISGSEFGGVVVEWFCGKKKLMMCLFDEDEELFYLKLSDIDDPKCTIVDGDSTSSEQQQELFEWLTSS